MGMGMKEKFNFGYADSWLLLSIIYAQKQGDPDLSNIIGCGDFINHAIFSLEEIQGGMYRLIQSGYVIMKKSKFFPSDKIVIPYQKFSRHKNSIIKDLEFIRKALNAPEWSSSYNASKANKNGSCDEITKEIVEKAHKEYVCRIKGNSI
jgi:hypothetical protein